MGISDTIGSTTLNQLHSYTNLTQFIAYNASLNFTQNGDLATRVCNASDDFLVVSKPIFVDTEVSKLPFRVT